MSTEADPASPTLPSLPLEDVDAAEHYGALRRRCEAAGIAIEQRGGVRGESYLILQLPNGRDRRPVVVVSSRDAKRLIDIPLERYVFLASYLAIASYDDCSVEAVIRTNSPVGLPSSIIFQRLFGVDPHDRSSPTELKPIELQAPGDSSHIRIVLGTMSKDLQALTDRRAPRFGSPSLRISSPAIKNHDSAVAILERVSNALFFDLDLRFNLPLSLAKERRRTARGRTSMNEGEARDVTFPRYEYPAEPMSLYWYARSAVGMPLLQFLAFYQCIEFFFPIYSQAEVQRRVKNLLKDPTFQAHRDTDIARLLQVASSGRGVADERAQLRNTVLECLDPAELKTFISEVPERAEFLAKDKVVCDRRVPLSAAADVRNDLAERIYEIRCKIVHTKAGGGDSGVDLLLPFSKEAEALDHDIDIIQYVARRVLVASGGDIKL